MLISELPNSRNEFNILFTLSTRYPQLFLSSCTSSELAYQNVYTQQIIVLSHDTAIRSIERSYSVDVFESTALGLMFICNRAYSVCDLALKEFVGMSTNPARVSAESTF
jgi:predicted glycosyltransferase involved in capsule biosynthesis